MLSIRRGLATLIIAGAVFALAQASSPPAQAQALVSGPYLVQVTNSGVKTTVAWRLQIVGTAITGTYESNCCPGHRIDPIQGSLNGSQFTITRDCRGQGYAGACRQVYVGRVANGNVAGTFSGTGAAPGNKWIFALAPTPAPPNLIGTWYSWGRGDRPFLIANEKWGLFAWADMAKTAGFTTLHIESGSAVVADGWGIRGTLSNNATRIDWQGSAAHPVAAGFFWSRQPTTPTTSPPVTGAPPVTAAPQTAPRVTAPPPTAPPATAPATTVPPGIVTDWEMSPRANNTKDKFGQRFTYTCPPSGTKHPIYGTDIYSDDSSICTAAVHAGRIDFATGGTVTIEIGPSAQYVSTTRHGITSGSFEGSPSSYHFVP